MAETPHPFDLLEPNVGAVALGQEAVAAQLSTAISLKRIADVLERAAPNGALDEGFFSNAAYFAGQAFERGRR